MAPEVIADYQCVVGEGPLWHPQEKRLYWVDIPMGRIYRYDPATNTHGLFHQGDLIGGFTFQADGALLLFGARGAVTLLRDGVQTTVIDEIPEERNSRFNDVIADPEGRVFCGTMPSEDHPASLYRLDPDGTLTRVLDDVGLSNGLAFSPDLSQLYYTDTFKHVIYRFAYDRASGALSKREVFAQTAEGEGEGMPDGMTVDEEGCIWSARWDGSCLVRYAPDGKELRRFTFPARKVSSAVFGGEDFADLYVTTAGGDNKAENGADAGALFRFRPGVRGPAEFFSRIGQ